MNDPSATKDTSSESLVTEVADEFIERLNRGEQPEIEEYVKRYPQIATVIRQVLPALQTMRTLIADSTSSLAAAGSRSEVSGRSHGDPRPGPPGAKAR